MAPCRCVVAVCWPDTLLSACAVQTGDGLDAVLAREALWHALGEAVGLLGFEEQLSFEAWYQQELRAMLVASLQVSPLYAGLHHVLGAFLLQGFRC